MHCTIVPPYLLSRIAGLQDGDLRPAVQAAQLALLDIEPLRQTRQLNPVLPQQKRPRVRPTGPNRTISDAQNKETLPGSPVRSENEDPTGDSAVNDTYEKLGISYRLLADAYHRSSIDGRSMALDATVHYGQDYENAFWNGSRMVLGDGDGIIFRPFTGSLTVIAHELFHGLTQFSNPLRYSGQAGALNESISDVFAALTEQHYLQQDAATASWLIGADLFTDSVQGNALRSLKAPGTAYADDRLGEDPQPATMAEYLETTADDGGVHINSGIANHAFYRVAVQLGGFAWERAGKIWYDAVVTGDLPADCDFARFAGTTTATADALFGPDSAETAAVRQAWVDVGVLDGVNTAAVRGGVER